MWVFNCFINKEFKERNKRKKNTHKKKTKILSLFYAEKKEIKKIKERKLQRKSGIKISNNNETEVRQQARKRARLGFKERFSSERGRLRELNRMNELSTIDNNTAAFNKCST